ncbi:MAG: class I SAM-dependent methyltransferase [Actinomycetia bacterium]|nr:class I SAM-dependent methyltransferase [Actinomycetes bacterium]
MDQATVNLGQTILEIGCGPGFFTEALAQKVGVDGKVIAQDVAPKMIAKLKKRSRRFPIFENIEPLLANSSNTGLQDESVSLIFAVHVFEEIIKEGEMERTANELFRVLKEGGSLYFGEHRVRNQTLRQIINDLTQAGFKRSEVDKKLFFDAALFKK